MASAQAVPSTSSSRTGSVHGCLKTADVLAEIFNDSDSAQQDRGETLEHQLASSRVQQVQATVLIPATVAKNPIRRDCF